MLSPTSLQVCKSASLQSAFVAHRKISPALCKLKFLNLLLYSVFSSRQSPINKIEHSFMVIGTRATVAEEQNKQTKHMPECRHKITSV